MAAFVFFAMGCGNQFVRELEFNAKNELDVDNNSEQLSALYADQITEQWLNSAHAKPTESTIGRDGCVKCHDGKAFSVQNDKAADITTPSGQNCLSCHSSYGSELKQKGQVSIPTKETFRSGTGALCMSCHNSNSVPNISDPRRTSPHYSAQADVLTGSGGIRISEDIQFNNTFGHISLDNSCADCHMPMLEEGFRSHTFSMENEYAHLTCAKCHENVADFNIRAKADYDGDGTIEGMQDEVLGLKNILYNAISEELDGGYFETSRGSIVFFNAQGQQLNEVSDEIYLAAYNYYLIKNDGSKGIHNPLFTVHLLQQSYKILTGKDVEGASIIQ